MCCTYFLKVEELVAAAMRTFLKTKPNSSEVLGNKTQSKTFYVKRNMTKVSFQKRS
jgi:hypothetical protein